MKTKNKLRYIGRYVIEDKTLGKGNFAVVELATHSITKTKVAVKVIDRHQIKEDYVRQNLNREARILGQLRHPNVVRLYETISSSSLYCLVTELAGGGDLLAFVRSQRDGRLLESDARPYVRQLVSALHHLHERGVVHRDLKMENIMMDARKKNIKIVDFGLSNCFSADQLLSTHCGSPEYAAPELFTAGSDYYGPEVDIWSLGINIYAMVCGKLPFTTPHSENRRQRLLQQLRYGLGPLQEKDMAKLSAECRDLLHMCIEPNPELRAPLLDIEVQPWLTENGTKPFCPYKQPRKDTMTRQTIINKMAVLLNLSKEKIESHIHEYRLDNVSAIFNLLMDDHLSSKGYWKIDHTMYQEVKRPADHHVDSNAVGIRVDIKQHEDNGYEDQNQYPGSIRVSLRTPTIIGMVRPSQADSCTQRRLKSADFELRAINNPKAKLIRPKTASFAQASKAKPMGNATTQNIVVARYNNFGAAIAQQKQLCRECKIPCRPTCQQEHSCQDRCVTSSPEQGQHSPRVTSKETAKTEQKKKLKFWLEADGNNLKDQYKSRTSGNHQNQDGQKLNTGYHESLDSSAHHAVNQDHEEGRNFGLLQRVMREQRDADPDPPPNSEKGYTGKSADVPHYGNTLLINDVINEESVGVQFYPFTPRPKENDGVLESDDENGCQDVTNDPNLPDLQKEVKVINMAQYFNNKHGYKLRETPVNVYVRKTRKGGQEQKVSYQLCEEHRNQVSSELAQAANTVTYKTKTPYSGPALRKDDKVQAPPTIDIKLPRPDEGYQSDSESEHGRSVTPQKAKWRPRLYKQIRRTPVMSPSLSGQSPRPHRCDCSPPCRSSIPNERPLYCTPVASLQTTRDILNCIPMQVVDSKAPCCDEEDVDTLKNRMPQRPSWKRQDAMESAVRKKVVEMKKRNVERAKELMMKDSLHERYPQEANMRLQSAKIRTPVVKSPRTMSSPARTNRTISPDSDKTRQEEVARHAACSPRSAKSAGVKMEKYSGQCTSEEQPSYVIDMSKQHMLTLLQEASTTMENATKFAERTQCQSQLHYYHQASHQRQPEKSWQKAIQQLQPHHYDKTPLNARPVITDSITDSYERRSTSRPATVRALGKSRCYGSARSTGGIASQLGQRVVYTEGFLNPWTGQPPTVSTPSPPPMFDLESTFNMTDRFNRQSRIDNERVKSGRSDASKANQEWDIGYTLERKLSNTIKGGSQLSQMRTTPYHMQ